MRLPIKLDLKWKAFLLCLFIIGGSAFLAHLVQNDFGNIDIKTIRIVDESGLAVTGKLYRPIQATEDNPAPAVLLLHGMNNDKDTEAPAALELARRGIVALALDQLSHGDSDPVDSPLGFLASGSDYTLGANASYQYLKSLSFVDESSTGLVGHSMGAGVARAIASTNPDHRAIVIQAGGPDNLTTHGYMNNYLNVWALYEELFTTDARAIFSEKSLEMIAQNEGLISIPGESDYTYGDFSNSSAHRYARCPCTHPGATWNAKGVAETTAWMLQALMGMSETDAWASASGSQTYMILEVASLFTVIVSVVSLIPLAGILLEVPYFQSITRPITEKIPTKGSSWWKLATLNSIIGGVTFLFLPMLGLMIGAIVGAFIPVFLLATGNGSVLWLLANALIAWILYRRWFKRVSVEEGITHADVGRFESIKNSESREIIFRTVIMSVVMFGYLYGLVTLSQSYLGIEFRYMWPVFKLFTPLKFTQFILYIIPIFPFFLINAGVLLFGMLKQENPDSSLKTQFTWWIKAVFAMESTLLVAILLQYVPMFLFGTGPLLAFGGLFGLYGIFLMQILPVFAGIFFIMTAFYLKTGRIYLGSIMGTLITVWILTAGMLI
ncbi:MAG: alpha/beta fold hydrolase [Candidatus Thorarchaeota archaeon]